MRPSEQSAGMYLKRSAAAEAAAAPPAAAGVVAPAAVVAPPAVGVPLAAAVAVALAVALVPSSFFASSFFSSQPPRTAAHRIDSAQTRSLLVMTPISSISSLPLGPGSAGTKRSDLPRAGRLSSRPAGERP